MVHWKLPVLVLTLVVRDTIDEEEEEEEEEDDDAQEAEHGDFAIVLLPAHREARQTKKRTNFSRFLTLLESPLEVLGP